MFGLSGRTAALFAGILGLCVVTGALHYADTEPVAIFLTAAAALAGLFKNNFKTYEAGASADVKAAGPV